MQKETVNNYIIANQKFFPEEKIALLKEKLETAEDDKLTTISSVKMYDPTTILLVSIFLGSLGIDRFMLGETGMGVLKLLTLGCCGILTIVDWFTVSKKAKEKNFANVIAII